MVNLRTKSTGTSTVRCPTSPKVSLEAVSLPKVKHVVEQAIRGFHYLNFPNSCQKGFLLLTQHGRAFFFKAQGQRTEPVGKVRLSDRLQLNLPLGRSLDPSSAGLSRSSSFLRFCGLVIWTRQSCWQPVVPFPVSGRDSDRTDSTTEEKTSYSKEVGRAFSPD